MARHRLPAWQEGEIKCPTRGSRLKNAQKNWSKVRQQKKKRRRVDRVIKQGHCASLRYGAACLGTPKGILEYVKAKTRVTREGAGFYRSARLNTALTGCKEAARIVLAPVKAWAEEAWEEVDRQKVQIKAWWQQKRQLEIKAVASGESGVHKLWHEVRGQQGHVGSQ